MMPYCSMHVIVKNLAQRFLWAFEMFLMLQCELHSDEAALFSSNHVTLVSVDWISVGVDCDNCTYFS